MGSRFGLSCVYVTIFLFFSFFFLGRFRVSSAVKLYTEYNQSFVGIIRSLALTLSLVFLPF